jgi:MFS family permease
MHAAGFSRSQIASIAAAISCVAAVGIGLSLSIPLLSLEMQRMGVSNGLIGINTAVAGIASIIVVPFVPRMARRYGLMPLLWCTVLVVPVTMILFRIIHDFAAWFPLRFLFSAALGALFVLSEYWITISAPAARRGLVMGIYATVLAAGLAVGPLILAVVGSEGWPPYLAGAFLFALAAVPLSLARGLSPSIESGSGPRLLSLVRAAPIATLAALVFGVIETSAYALLPIYGIERGLSHAEAALLLSAVALGNVGLQIPIGILADRFDRRLILLACSLCSAIGAVLMPLFADMAGLMIPMFVWGGLTGALYTIGLAHLGSRFAGPALVSANAAFVLLYNVGLTAGPPIVGLGMDLLPPHGFAFALSACGAVYAALILFRLRAASVGS